MPWKYVECGCEPEFLKTIRSPVAFGRPERGPGNASVVGPSREHDPRRDFDFLVDRLNLEGAKDSSVGKRRHRARFPVRHHSRRIEAVPLVVDVSDRDHRSVGCQMRWRRLNARERRRPMAGMDRLTSRRSRNRRASGRRQAAPQQPAPADLFAEPSADLGHDRINRIVLRSVRNRIYPGPESRPGFMLVGEVDRSPSRASAPHGLGTAGPRRTADIQ